MDNISDLQKANFLKLLDQGMDIDYTVVDANHPITKNLPNNFRFNDEVYQFQVYEPDNHILITTHHPLSDTQIVFTRTYAKSKIVTIQPGHFGATVLDPTFALLFKNSVDWVTSTTVVSINNKNDSRISLPKNYFSALGQSKNKNEIRKKIQGKQIKENNLNRFFIPF